MKRNEAYENEKKMKNKEKDIGNRPQVQPRAFLFENDKSVKKALTERKRVVINGRVKGTYVDINGVYFDKQKTELQEKEKKRIKNAQYTNYQRKIPSNYRFDKDFRFPINSKKGYEDHVKDFQDNKEFLGKRNTAISQMLVTKDEKDKKLIKLIEADKNT